MTFRTRLVFTTKLILLLVLTGVTGNLSAQAPKANPEKNPVKAMFFQRYLMVPELFRTLRFQARHRLFRSGMAFHSPESKPGWTLTFKDDFDSVDEGKWRLGQPWGYFHDESLHQYHSTEQVWCDSGYLHLGGIYKPKTFTFRDSQIVIPYAIGLINSDISFEQKYGYFEIRCKNPSGPATWPAFWLTGVHRWPPEIDVFEMYGKSGKGTIHRQVSSIHYGICNTPSRGTLVRRTRLPANTDKAFHVYACSWTPHTIAFYTDGTLVRKQRINKRLKAFMEDEMVLIINNGFEAPFLKYLPTNFSGNVFTIDYVRVYQRSEQ